MKILISDTHFGCRQNSPAWLDSQMKFFDEQLIPFIQQQKKSGERVYLYHLGDVFDSRASVNLFVADRVKRLFGRLKHMCDRVIIIGGNHDYYSPTENDDNVNSLRLILGDLEDDYHNFVIVDRENYERTDEREIFIPWFRYYDFDDLVNELHNGKYNEKNFDRIFIHNDLTVTLENRYRELFGDYEVFSGHIHTPKHAGNLHTLGSVFALTFADANQRRGFYTMNDDGSDFKFHANECSIKFWRWYNGDIFGNYPADRNDYVELYISQDNMSKDSYIQRMRELSQRYPNMNILPITSYHFDDGSSTDFERYDIQDICAQNIPDTLKEKFDKISSEDYGKEN